VNELTLPLRNLLGRPLRAVLTILGIAVAVGGFVALTGLTAGVQHSFSSGIQETGADLVVSQKNTFNVIGSTVPASLGPTLSVEGVQAVSGVLLNVMTIDEQANIVVAGWPDGSFLWGDVHLTKGRLPKSGENAVVLGSSIAGALGKGLGDTVELQYQPYAIVGIADFATALNENIAIVPLAGMQQLLSRPNILTLYELQLTRPVDDASVAAIKTRLTAAAPDYDVGTTDQFASNIQLFSVLSAVAATVSLVVLAMASIVVANTLLMAVTERTFEIGVLAAVGWSPLRILRLILIEGVLMSAVGGIIGIGLGVIAMELASRTQVAAGMLESYLTAGSVVRAMVFVLIAGPLGALYPAWRATRLQPAEALRST
jgi:putative ABC transport system permease protein